jgi:formylglycine-generating enzyme required for sulfatase activity
MTRILLILIFTSLISIFGCKKDNDSDEDEKKVPEFEMVFVEGGIFMMGSDHYNFEEPIHEVTLSSFNIAKYQVTQKEWKSIMGDNPSSYKGDNLPIHKVSWYEVNEFISRLNQATGKNYRLPTEAEWEYAAGGGNKGSGFTYSGSNNFDKVAWHGMNSNFEPHPVGSKTANELGIYDMSGNVWEWCNDWFEFYSSTPQTDPLGPMSGTYKVIRGGHWGSIDSYCRVKMRMRCEPERTLKSLCGFRLVLQ